MTRKPLAVFTFIVIILTTLACQMISSQTASQATIPPAEKVAQVATVAPSPSDTPEPTVDMAAVTREAEKQAQATASAEARATHKAAAEKVTQQAANRKAKTATAAAKATGEASELYSIVNQLHSDGVLQQTSGRYYTIDDFNESWAQINWYQWWYTDYSPANFVLRANTNWESASRTANIFASGCGFVFRESGEDNHYMIYLALDGNVYLKGYVKGQLRELGREYVGKIDHMQGEAEVILVVEGDKIVYYVDGVKVFQRQNKELREGNLALTLISGTNKDYGTRCGITDIELWELDK